MAAYTGIIDNKGRNGEPGERYVASGYYTWSVALANADTITFTNLLPLGGAIVRNAWYVTTEIDTNATPTATAVLGNSDDDDGYIIAQGVGVGLSNSLAEKCARFASVEPFLNTTITNRDVIFKVNAAVATGASAGTIRVFVELEGGA